ncbi:MAG: HDOD domain-containing protein [Deltaproteobacteria bacterium]|nr:HDOD domain-containing protein [Deltaproteobacteria bacterium]
MLSFFRKKKVEDPKALLTQALGERELPNFPRAVMQTLKLLRDPASTTAQIAQSIEVNPGLAVKSLSIANSAAFGLRNRVGSVAQAVTLLGRARIESLVVVRAVRDQLQVPPTPGFSTSRFWKAAARRAAIARALAYQLHPETQADSFMEALLQDMAVPMLVAVRPSDYGPMVAHWYNTEEARLEALERETFGWDHPDIGASLAMRWELPERLVGAVGCHHDADSDNQPAVRLAGLISETKEEPDPDVLVEACRGVGMGADATVELYKKAIESASEIASLLM